MACMYVCIYVREYRVGGVANAGKYIPNDQYECSIKRQLKMLGDDLRICNEKKILKKKKKEKKAERVLCAREE